MSPSIFLNYITFNFFPAPKGYEIFKEDSKKTCRRKKGNLIITRPLFTFKSCVEICDKNKKCDFFFWSKMLHTQGLCMTFKDCKKKKLETIKGLLRKGTTYQKE